MAKKCPLKKILISAALLWLWPAGLPAYFLDNVHGVRPAGMGEAFVSIADDTNAMLFNPAGLSQVQQLEFQGMFSELYSGLDDRMYNQQKDRIGYGLAALAIPDAGLAGVVGIAWNQFYSMLYRENIFYLSYARPLWTQIGLSAGITMKVLHWQVDLNETVDPLAWSAYTELNKIGATADLGLLASPWTGWRFGFAVDNVIPVDMGLTTEARVPQVYRLGAAFDIPWHPEPLSSITSIVEVNTRNGWHNIKGGLESWWYQNLFAIRVGANIDQFTSGLGFRFTVPDSPLRMQLDYAFSYPFQIQDSLGSHRGGLTIIWDLKTHREKLKRQAAKVSQAQAATMELAEAHEQLRVAREQLAQKEQDFQAAQAALAEARAAVAVAAGGMGQTAVELDKNQAALFPANNRDTLLIGYQTKILSDLAYTQDVRQRAQELELFLERMTGLEIQQQGYTGLRELDEAFVNGELDLVISSGQFSEFSGNNLAKPLVSVLMNGKNTRKHCLVVSDDSPLKKPEDLRNKRLGYFSWKDIKRLKTEVYRSEREFRPELYFQELKPLKSARGSILDLHLGTMEAIWSSEYILAVYEMNKSTLTKALEVIAWSETEVSFDPLVYTRINLNKSKKEKIKLLKEALLALHQEMEGKTFLDFFHFDKFVPYQQSP